MRPQLPEGLAVTYAFHACTSRRPPRGEKECVETLATVATLVSAPHNYGLTPTEKGVAILNPDDHFSMRIAKEVALGRALKEYATGTARGPFVTKTGRVLTDSDIEKLADEVEKTTVVRECGISPLPVDPYETPIEAIEYQRHHEIRSSSQLVKCPSCRGEGRIDRDDMNFPECGRCGGYGRVKSEDLRR